MMTRQDRWGDNRLTQQDYARARLKDARQAAARLWARGARVEPLAHRSKDAHGSLMALELGRLVLSTLDLGEGETGWHLQPHAGVAVMLRMIRGGVLQLEGQQILLPAGQIALLPPGTRFELILPRGGRQDLALLDGFTDQVPACTVLGTDIAASHHLAFMAGYLLRCAPHPTERANRLRDEMILALRDVIDDLLLKRQQPAETDFERFGFLVNASLARSDLTVTDIASGMGISVRQLQRLVAAHGTSFRHFVHQRRLELAQELIASAPHQLRVSEVAYRCGFRDPNYFSRAYARHWGTPPSQGSRPH